MLVHDSRMDPDVGFPSPLKAKAFHLGLPHQSLHAFCSIFLMEKAVLGFLILAVRLSPILFSPWKLFFLYCPKVFHVLTPPLTCSPIASVQEGISAPASAGGSRWQQQSALEALNSKISARKQRGSQEAGILNTIIFSPGTSLVLIFSPRSPTCSVTIIQKGFSFYFLLHLHTWVIDRSLGRAPLKT